MNILFVFKRFYTNKDVIQHRFGRLYEFPAQLARLGHQVNVLCLDYKSKDKNLCVDLGDRFDPGAINWIVARKSDLLPRSSSGIYKKIKLSAPALVVGSSDIPSLWLAKKLAIKLSVPYVVDLYDNYESFGQARIPGFMAALRGCVKAADLIVAVSNDLKDKIREDYKPLSPIAVISNGTGRSNFFEGDRNEARTALGLPLHMQLIGTAGTLSTMKGLDTVYAAWRKIERSVENVCLVLAGRKDASLPLPQGKRVFYLGELLEAEVGKLFRALDVGIIPAHDSEFGRYCFPQKLYEMVACGLPIVAADVGAIACVLQDSPGILFAPGSAEGLAEALSLQLREPQKENIKVKEWSELVSEIEPVLLKLAQYKKYV